MKSDFINLAKRVLYNPIQTLRSLPNDKIMISAVIIFILPLILSNINLYLLTTESFIKLSQESQEIRQVVNAFSLNPEKDLIFFKLLTLSSQTIVSLVGLFLSGLIIYWIIKIIRRKNDYKKIINILGYANTPLLLVGIFAAMIMLTQSGAPSISLRLVELLYSLVGLYSIIIAIIAISKSSQKSIN